MVHWRLSTDKPLEFVSTSALGTSGSTIPDISGVQLVAKQADLILKSGHWGNGAALSGDCTCGWVPRGMGPAGVELTNLYPALPASVTEIRFEVPGFPAITAPVTRK